MTTNPMKAFRTIQSGISILAILLFVAFSGCNSTSNQAEQADEAADTLVSEIALSPEAQNMLNSMPTPFEVTTLLEKAKAGFVFDITNPPANVDKYITEVSKGLNLGIYSADLSYSATYNRKDETNQFLSCTNKLANDLGIAGVYDQTLLDKVKIHSNNKDSMMALIVKVFGQTNEFLARNNRTKIAVLIASGAFAEGLYLASTLGEVAKDNTKIMAIVAAQKETHMKLLTILEAYAADNDMKPIFDNIQKLKPIWGNYNIESGKQMDRPKVAEIADLTEGVRNAFAQ